MLSPSCRCSCVFAFLPLVAVSQPGASAQDTCLLGHPPGLCLVCDSPGRRSGFSAHRSPVLALPCSGSSTVRPGTCSWLDLGGDQNMCPKAPAPAPHHWEHDLGPTASGAPRALGTYCWQGVDPDGARGSFAPQDCPGIFSAGLDLLEMYGRDPAHYAEYWKAVQELWLRVYLSSLVVISAINGVSPAGGCLLSLSCDYRVLANNPKYAIGLNETLLGIIAPFWFKDMLVNTIGHRAAERALQLGLLFPPADALQVGIVDQVVPEDQVQSTSRSVMAQWLAIPDHARQLTKNLVRKPTADRLLQQRDADIQNFVRFISRDSIQKSLHVYLEKLKEKKG
uniref:Enoyl-CoA delta isomerase 1, mitochondrial n=1 Tax=Ailuropoda melanoleuca TaxID=9646 RepID=A0A7N5JXY0_AILME